MTGKQVTNVYEHCPSARGYFVADLKFGDAKISIPSTKQCMAATNGRRRGFDEEGAELMKKTSGDGEWWEAGLDGMTVGLENF